MHNARDRLPHRHHQIAVIVHVQPVAVEPGFNHVIAGRLRNVMEDGRRDSAGAQSTVCCCDAAGRRPAVRPPAASGPAAEVPHRPPEADAAAQWPPARWDQVGHGQVVHGRLAQVEHGQRRRAQRRRPGPQGLGVAAGRRGATGAGGAAAGLGPAGAAQVGQKVAPRAGPAAAFRAGRAGSAPRTRPVWPAVGRWLQDAEVARSPASISPGSKAGVPTTSRGGAAISTSVKPSPGAAFSHDPGGHCLACSKRLLLVGPVGHRVRGVDAPARDGRARPRPWETRPVGSKARPRPAPPAPRSACAAPAAAIPRSNSRRRCLRRAASRYCIAAQGTSR